MMTRGRLLLGLSLVAALSGCAQSPERPGTEHAALRAETAGQTQACESGDARDLRKRVAVAGFALAHPEQARLGKLHNAERALPEYLYQRLDARGRVEPLALGQQQLYADTGASPTVLEADNRAHKSLALARELQVQFVVSGVIRDMLPVEPGAWDTSVLDRMSRGLGLVDLGRRFAVDLVIHDGFSGSPVLERRYTTEGLWTADRHAEVGFLTPAFQELAYGRAVARLLDEVARDIDAELRCQPFMTRITRVEDQQVYLASGASAGLRPGQEMSIYRRFEFIDMPGSRYELQSTGTRLKIDQVHPEFSRGRIPVQAGRRNIQQGDIAIIR